MKEVLWITAHAHWVEDCMLYQSGAMEHCTVCIRWNPNSDMMESCKSLLSLHEVEDYVRSHTLCQCLVYVLSGKNTLTNPLTVLHTHLIQLLRSLHPNILQHLVSSLKGISGEVQVFVSLLIGGSCYIYKQFTCEFFKFQTCVVQPGAVRSLGL